MPDLNQVDAALKYVPYDYKSAIEQKKKDEEDQTTTSSMNALYSLGAAGSIALASNDRKDLAIPLLGGVASSAAGYHGARILGWSPAIRLIIAGILGAGGVVAADYGVRKYNKQ